PDLLEDRGVVEVDTSDGKIGLGRLRLLFDAKNAAVGEFRATEALRIVDFLEKDVGTFGLIFEGFRGGDNIVLNDVVAQHDADFLAFDEGLSETQGVSDATLAFLVGVVDSVQIEILAVGKETQEIARVLSASNDDDVAEARVH